MKLSSEIKAEIGKSYSGIGTCGISKDKKIVGELIEIDSSSCSAILKDDKGRVHDVNYRTLELI